MAATANAASTPEYLMVIDPLNRTGKIQLPFRESEHTAGRQDWITSANSTGRKKDISLCMLYQSGKCNRGSRCNQIHANRELIATLREHANATKKCCSQHGDVHSNHDAVYMSHVEQLGAITLHDGQGNVIKVPASAFARTVPFENLIKSPAGPLTVAVSRICRLQQRNCCKYGRDCKNIHICQQLGKSILGEDGKGTTATAFNSAKPLDPMVPPIPLGQVTVGRQPIAPLFPLVVGNTPMPMPPPPPAGSKLPPVRHMAVPPLRKEEQPASPPVDPAPARRHNKAKKEMGMRLAKLDPAPVVRDGPPALQSPLGMPPLDDYDGTPVLGNTLKNALDGFSKLWNTDDDSALNRSCKSSCPAGGSVEVIRSLKGLDLEGSVRDITSPMSPPLLGSTITAY